MESTGLLPHSLLYTVGNFQRRTFCKFRSLGAIHETFLREIWGRGILWHGKSEQSAQSYFSPIRDSFPPGKFPALRYASKI